MRVGILGGGQLGQMLAMAGLPLGIASRCLDPSPEAPAGRVAELEIGQYEDHSTLVSFLRDVDVVTYEWENVPVEAARWLAERVPTYPNPGALETAQDRLLEKQLFRELGIPVPTFVPVSSRGELEIAVERVGVPAVLKTRRFGYDGNGQYVLRDRVDLGPAWQELGGVPLILEAFVPFEREVSLLAVRSAIGETTFYPLVENHHAEGILRWSRSRPTGSTNGTGQAGRSVGGTNSGPEERQAVDFGTRVLDQLAYVGVLAIEFFQTAEGELIANEMAPRVHNSGHWTIEGANTSQFENHLRAIFGLPLGHAEAVGAAAMVNVIGDAPPLRSLLAIPRAKVHLYGKSPRPKRKLGHVTLVAPEDRLLDEPLGELRSLLIS